MCKCWFEERRKIADNFYDLVAGLMLIPVTAWEVLWKGAKFSSSDLVTLKLPMKHQSVNV